MTPEQIQKLADGLPPSCMGKDHEEVVAWLAKQHIALQQQVNALAAANSAKGRCLAFFACVIKTGEPWTETCQREYDAAQLRQPEEKGQ